MMMNDDEWLELWELCVEGTAHVYGLSINEDMPTIRNMMALCPQFDILWDNLTGKTIINQSFFIIRVFLCIDIGIIFDVWMFGC